MSTLVLSSPRRPAGLLSWVVVVFLRCFCVFVMVFLYVFFVKGRLSSHYREVMQRVLTTLV